jgi:Zn-dependent M28 family amino/carboxypeptidase
MRNYFFQKELLLVFMMLSFIASAQIISNFKAHTIYLSSDQLEGRGNGSRGIVLAADYISKQFELIGLNGIEGGSYFQKFPYPEQDQLESNVIGVIPALHATNKSIVFTAHYDAYGIHKIEGSNDSIHNGARDNAIGVAALIELARMYKSEKAPSQNIVFIATAAEEFGQYGAEFYAENPVYSLNDITICLNIDGFNVSGVREDFFVMPRQGVDFIDEIELIAKEKGWIYNPPDWIDGMNINFDSSSFLRRKVPAFTLWVGNQLKGGEEAAQVKFGAIHSPNDEISDSWNWDGVMDHLELYKAISDYFLNYPSEIKVTDPELFKGN